MADVKPAKNRVKGLSMISPNKLVKHFLPASQESVTEVCGTKRYLKSCDCAEKMITSASCYLDKYVSSRVFCCCRKIHGFVTIYLLF